MHCHLPKKDIREIEEAECLWVQHAGNSEIRRLHRLQALREAVPRWGH